LDEAELKVAFKRAGLDISASKFEEFFAEIDANHDGLITFDEWR
jgi:solute carrier family 25 phosphate transporter 23/24/25/41